MTGSVRPVIGFAGIGKMGAPMARRIIAAGYTLRAFDRDPARLREVPGAVAAGSLADLAAGTGIIVSSLPDDAALRAVALGAEGLLASLRPGAVWVDTSTVSPAVSAQVRRAQRDGDRFLAAPVSGNMEMVEAGRLTCFCSGPAEAFARAEPVLGCFARVSTRVGANEEARALKLAINHFIGSAGQIAAEALALGRKGGVPWDALLEALAQSAAATPLLAHKAAALRARDFTPTFTVRQMLKDMELIVEAGTTIGVDMPIARLVRDSFARQSEGRLAELDYFAAVLEREQLAGLDDPKLGEPKLGEPKRDDPKQESP